MRLLLAIHNAYTETGSGAARSLRIVTEWLHQAGTSVRVLSTARFESGLPIDPQDQFNALGVPLETTHGPGDPCAELRFELAGVPVTAIQTRHNLNHEPNVPEGLQFLRALDAEFRDHRPDILLTYGGNPVIPETLARARAKGVQTVFTLRAFGYSDRRFFTHVDRVLVNSDTLAEHYLGAIGLRSAAIPSPIMWNEVIGPTETRRFVTFVNASLHKGAALVARLADMLGRNRPDIPLLIVDSSGAAKLLAAIPGLDLARHSNIMVSPLIGDQRGLFGVTRILLAPSVFAEPFGRVAAEAMVNAIPPIVSDRGNLPRTVQEGGIVVPLPEWMTVNTRRVPTEQEVKPWFDAIVRLWDDPTYYGARSRAAAATAGRLYDENNLRQRTIDYFTTPGPFPPLFDPA